MKTTTQKCNIIYAFLWYHAHPSTGLKSQSHQSSLEKAKVCYSKLPESQVLRYDHSANVYDFFFLFARRRMVLYISSSSL